MGMRGMAMKAEKARDFRGTMRKLLRYLSAFKAAILVVVVFAIASTVFSIVGPKVLGLAITRLFEGANGQIAGSSAGIDFEYIGAIILIMVGLYGISTLFSYAQGWIMSGVSMKVTYRFRKDISEKINRMPLKYFDGTNHGEVLSRVTNDVDTVRQTPEPEPHADHHPVVTVIGVTVMMLSISWAGESGRVRHGSRVLVIAVLVISQSQHFRSRITWPSTPRRGDVRRHQVVSLNGEETVWRSSTLTMSFLYASAWSHSSCPA
jgi:ATP-binding cassette subfamily B protein